MDEPITKRSFYFCKAGVWNRGTPPDSFLNELLDWARKAPDVIFAPNTVPVDIFTVIKSSLGTKIGEDSMEAPIYKWDDLLHRKSALLEAMRVHAGFESSWNWNEGVDLTNKTSMKNKTGEETGIFQVSFDSEWLGAEALGSFSAQNDIETPEKFITAMKVNHELALEYYARLSRISIRWAGPLLRHGSDSIYPYLKRDAVLEFQKFLACA